MNYRPKRYADAAEIYDNVAAQFCSGCNCTGKILK